MKELFAPYELALLAKEKGFDEPCLYSYGTANNDGAWDLAINDDHSWWQHNSKTEYGISAPFYQQLIDYFRDKYNLIIEVEITSNSYIPIVKERNKKHYISGIVASGVSSDNFHEALNKALEEAFKLIK